MKKILLFIFIMMIILSSYDIFAAGSGGGGRVIKRSQTTQETSQQETNEIQQKIVDLSQGLKCGNLVSREERVRCRFNLENEEYARENELSYLPEECRDLTGERKNNCISLYKKTQRCWKFSVGDARIKCVKENLGLVRSHREEKIECRKIDGEERGKCISNLREKAFDLVKFRFYDLEERAEKLKDKGVASEDDVVKLVAALEEKKIEFNNASTISEKKKIILDVRQIWKDFVLKIKRGEKENAEQSA